MKVSLNIVKQLTGIELPPVDELVARVNAQLGGVEEVIDLKTKYKDATIVKIIECEKHANADKLSVCKIDAGTDELVQVVCGAPNVKAGMWAVWLPPESIVPSTFEDDEPFVLGARELRGEMSNGMLASAKELSLGDDHSGIVEMTEADLPEGKGLEAGASFAKTFELDDTILDIENKMFTHRPDCFGQLGVARELSGIFGTPFADPEWYVEKHDLGESQNSFDIKSFNETGALVPRMMLVGMSDVVIQPSPLWLQSKLVSMGGKPINNIVDITNYLMLMTAQPTHVYDYDKLVGGAVGARMAKQDEKITLLNGKTHALTTEDIVIADADKAIGLAGIMGSKDSEVSADTTRIVLECATFDMYTLRKSSMRHGIFTDALTRFNKGQSMLMNPYIVQYAISLFKTIAGAKLATDVLDDMKRDDEWRAKPAKTPMLESAVVSIEFINQRLGTALTSDEIVVMLENVGFECSTEGDNLTYWAPAWRMDIQLSEDIVEEVGRLYGFDKLPRELPSRSTKATPRNQSRVVKQSTRAEFEKLGANEVLTYSFVHEKILRNAKQDPKYAYKLSNALSPDLQYYRTSLTSSLLAQVHMNVKAGHSLFALYEIGKTHFKGVMNSDEPEVPYEEDRIGFVLAAIDKVAPTSSAFYQAKRYVERITDLNEFDIVPLADFDLSADEQAVQLTAPYAPQRSAAIVKDGTVIGVIGEYLPAVQAAFKLPKYAAGFEIKQSALTRLQTEYQPLSKYPSVSQDVTFSVLETTKYQELEDAVSKSCSSVSHAELSITYSLVGIFQAEHASRKNISFRIVLSPQRATLTSAQANEIVTTIVNSVTSSLDANVV